MKEAPTNSTHPLTRAEWRAWLGENHTRPEGVWLVTYKKATGKPRVEYEDAVEEALCFGWIDSKPNKLDEERTLLWFAPRKPGTGWSRPNKERVARALSAGLMMPAGLTKIEAAKQDGSWTALDGIEQLEMPADLTRGAGGISPGGGELRSVPPLGQTRHPRVDRHRQTPGDARQPHRRDGAAGAGQPTRQSVEKVGLNSWPVNRRTLYSTSSPNQNVGAPTTPPWPMAVRSSAAPVKA